jgi:hypothetical protein
MDDRPMNRREPWVMEPGWRRTLCASALVGGLLTWSIVACWLQPNWQHYKFLVLMCFAVATLCWEKLQEKPNEDF